MRVALSGAQSRQPRDGGEQRHNRQAAAAAVVAHRILYANCMHLFVILRRLLYLHEMACLRANKAGVTRVARAELGGPPRAASFPCSVTQRIVLGSLPQ